MTKNIGKSIKTRLLNLAKEEKQDYMKVLVRYLHETKAVHDASGLQLVYNFSE